MPVEVFIHKMTDHMESARVIRWLVKEGDRVEERQPLLEIETDKATAELESPASGILSGIRPGAVEGTEIPIGQPIAFIAQPGETVPVLQPLDDVTKQEEGQPVPLKTFSEHVEAKQGSVRATPAARRLARELGVNISLVSGGVPNGRINEDDVRAFASGTSGGFAMRGKAGTDEPFDWQNLTNEQRLTGQRMLESSQNAPQFALTVSADMTEALRLHRQLASSITAQTGKRSSITALLVKIVAAALRVHPRANASFENGRVKLYKRVNVGVAVGTEDGLIVPVIKNADQKSLTQITQDLEAFKEKSRGEAFILEDLIGGTFTISNLGMYDIDRFNAIIRPPESAILAVGRTIRIPIALPDDTIAVRTMVSLTLSVDHRVLDGIQAAKFLAEIRKRLEKPEITLGSQE